VLRSPNVTYVPNIFRQALAAPTFAAKYELKFRSQLGRPQEEPLNPRFPVG
jgi:hypothetical protein